MGDRIGYGVLGGARGLGGSEVGGAWGVTGVEGSGGSYGGSEGVGGVWQQGERGGVMGRGGLSPIRLLQDSSGLRLWKRRWFVLVDLCLYYYRGEGGSGGSEGAEPPGAWGPGGEEGLGLPGVPGAVPGRNP